VYVQSMQTKGACLIKDHERTVSMHPRSSYIIFLSNSKLAILIDLSALLDLIPFNKVRVLLARQEV
jgi:hypothetical protein